MQAENEGKTLDELSLDEMETHWLNAKAQES